MPIHRLTLLSQICFRSVAVCAFLFILCIMPVQAANLYVINGVTSEQDTRQAGDDVKVIEPVDAATCRYTDLANGFSLLYPSYMIADASLSKVRTLFADETTQIEVLYDNFSHIEANAADYIEYGNRFTGNTADHTVETDQIRYINGYRTHLLKWTRRPLARIANDKHYYFTAEIIKNSQEVYTIFVKSSHPIVNEQELVASFRIFAPTGTPGIYKPSAPSRTPKNPETQAFLTQYFSVTSPLRWGIFEPNAPDNMTRLTELESTLQYSFPFLVRYQSLDGNVPLRALQQAYAQKKYVELTLQTLLQDSGADALKNHSRSNVNAGIAYDILDGQYDEYLSEYAERLKAFQHPVLFRLNNEMNGDWCWYSAYYTAKDADIYISLWRYLQTFFAQQGVDNLIWIWNPHDRSCPDFKWNHYLMYYPGDEYVDVIGLTGYNTGTYFPGEKWREFTDIYTPLYAEYDQLFDRPFLITEFAANSVGGDKVRWINSMFREIHKFPKIKAALWWSGIDYDSQGQPGRIYLLDENDEVLKAFQQNLSASPPAAAKP